MLHSNAGERYRLVLLKNGGSVGVEARTQINNVGWSTLLYLSYRRPAKTHLLVLIIDVSGRCFDTASRCPTLPRSVRPLYATWLPADIATRMLVILNSWVRCFCSKISYAYSELALPKKYGSDLFFSFSRKNVRVGAIGRAHWPILHVHCHCRRNRRLKLGFPQVLFDRGFSTWIHDRIAAARKL